MIIRANINDIKTKKNIKDQCNQDLFFLKHKYSSRDKERGQINTIRNEKDQVTMDITGIKRIIKKYYKKYVNKLYKLGRIDKKTYNLPKLNQEGSEYLKRLTTFLENDIEAGIKKLLAIKNPGANGFIGKIYQTFTELKPILLWYIFSQMCADQFSAECIQEPLCRSLYFFHY